MPKNIIKFTKEKKQSKQKQHTKPDYNPFQSLADKWGSPWVARRELYNFSGGILHPKTVRKFDSEKTGPRGRVTLGRVVAYPVQELVDWMWDRVSFCDDPNEDRDSEGGKDE
jgi:hypothetical protein